ncbi:MAG: hypothetical protein KatS3mg021_2319 [Fimbriimonadales bacterium]|nr:MAG: hypothetical protein KatS3mg021_2319 [Fimbriimonadales bacterium]
MVWPHIVRWWDHDLYVSFFAPPQVSADPLTLRLHEKEKGKVGDYTIEFKGFETAGAMGQEGFRAIAVARVSHPRWERVCGGGAVPPDGSERDYSHPCAPA